VSGIDRTPLERVHQRIVRRRDILDDQPQVGLIKHVQHLVQTGFDNLVDELRIDQVLDFEREVAQDHRQRKVLHRTRAGVALAPFTLGIRAFFKHPVEGLPGNQGVLFVAGRFGQLRKSHRGEGIGEDVVGIDDRLSVAREREVPVVIAVMPVFPEKLAALNRTVQPLLALFHLVVKHREHPHLTALQPDEFIRVVDASVTIEAGEITAVLFILRVLEPKGQHTVQQLRLILIG